MHLNQSFLPFPAFASFCPFHVFETNKNRQGSQKQNVSFQAKWTLVETLAIALDAPRKRDWTRIKTNEVLSFSWKPEEVEAWQDE